MRISFLIIALALFDAGNSLTQVETIPEKEREATVVFVEVAIDSNEQINGAYSYPEVDAEFKGGTAAMQRFLQRNMRYPSKSVANGDQGKVYLKMIVDEKGRIKNVMVERGVSQELDREAKRVIEKMPRWKPALVKGKKVKSIIRIPIVYTLE